MAIGKQALNFTEKFAKLYCEMENEQFDKEKSLIWLLAIGLLTKAGIRGKA